MFENHGHPQKCASDITPGTRLQDLTLKLKEREPWQVFEADCTIVICMLNPSRGKTMFSSSEQLDPGPNLIALLP